MSPAGPRISDEQLDRWQQWIDAGQRPPIGVKSADLVRDLRDARARLAELEAPPEHDSQEPSDPRDPKCVAVWPHCHSGGYDPRCCRFPKPCSSTRSTTAPLIPTEEP